MPRRTDRVRVILDVSGKLLPEHAAWDTEAADLVLSVVRSATWVGSAVSGLGLNASQELGFIGGEPGLGSGAIADITSAPFEERALRPVIGERDSAFVFQRSLEIAATTAQQVGPDGVVKVVAVQVESVD